MNDKSNRQNADPDTPHVTGHVTDHAPGHVTLVGAGPGDPGLLTLAGRDALAGADVVIYDALANPKLLDHAPDAEHIYAGKRSGHHHLTQDQTNALLVKLGFDGKRVVRLKGGDPFVFGRGGEECEALAEAGVPFTVVPGVTAAVAAPAYAGIPVTHRDLNTGFALVTGHTKDRAKQDAETQARQAADPAAARGPDWQQLAKHRCLTFYMGVKALPDIAANLTAAGMSPHTPAAIIQNGTLPTQRTVTATLADLPAAARDAGIGTPAMIVVGDVVGVRERMSWFESRPLFGQTVLNPRTREQASGLTRKLQAAGAEVIECPTIRVDFGDPLGTPFSVPGDDGRYADEIDFHLVDGAGADVTIFTSAHAVHALRRRLADPSTVWTPRRLTGRIAAVGPATADVLLDRLGVRADLVGSGTGDDLVRLILRDLPGDRRFSAMQVCGNRTDDAVHAALGDRCESFAKLVVYRTLPVETLPDAATHALDKGTLVGGWATFTSSSTVTNLLDLIDPARLADVKLASIGPKTSATLRDRLRTPDVEAATPSIDALVDAMIRFETT